MDMPLHVPARLQEQLLTDAAALVPAPLTALGTSWEVAFATYCSRVHVHAASDGRFALDLARARARSLE